mmetsp:Transcript_131653/g.366921  ORF Transcript_131653/g.366921 Transcript_131653/m.366921 type:complete len:273 (-) Transcript_131653:337-1155(-)
MALQMPMARTNGLKKARALRPPSRLAATLGGLGPPRTVGGFQHELGFRLLLAPPRRRVLHHRHELVEADVAIAVLVHLTQELLDSAFVIHAGAKHLGELLPRDAPPAGRVEGGEGGLHGARAQVVSLLQHGGQELCVVDTATAVDVCSLHELRQVAGDLAARSGCSLRNLLQCQRAIPILVHNIEDLAQFLQLPIVELPGNDLQGSPFEPVLVAEGAHSLAYDVSVPALDLTQGVFSRSFSGDPRVVHRLLGRKALFGVPLHHVADELLGVV